MPRTISSDIDIAEAQIARRRSRTPTNSEPLDDDRIKTLIKQSNEEHLKSRNATAEAMLWGREAGYKLPLLRAHVLNSGGKWLTWQEANKDKFEYSTRSARLYMWLAKLPEEDWQRVAKMPLRDAAQELRKADKDERDPPDPKTPPPLAKHFATLI